MKLSIKKLSLYFFILSLTACNLPQKEAISPKPTYFDIKGFIISEIEYLKNKKLIKKANNTFQEIQKPDWEKELSLLFEADINKPIYRESYQKIENDSLIEYTAIEDNMKVRKLHIVKKNQQPQEIKAWIEEKNNLYESSKEFHIQCQNGHITAYSIKGLQKIVMNEGIHFSVEGEVK